MCKGVFGRAASKTLGVEARRLVCEIAGVEPETLIIRPETPLAGHVVEAIDGAVTKRVDGHDDRADRRGAELLWPFVRAQ